MTTTEQTLGVDPKVYARQADNVPLLDWRFNSEQCGKHLYQKLFADHPEVLGSYKQALGEVHNEEKLHLRFESARDFLRVPLEFLVDEPSAAGDYFVLKHPLTRSISDVRVRKTLLSPTFLNELWIRREPFRILLVASNTWSIAGIDDIPGVDEEISVLDASLKALFEDRGISVQIKTIPTERATHKMVKKVLKNCKYHVVHYAGHGTYEQSPEESHLSFWERPNRQGSVQAMPASQLQLLLRGSDVRFVYLSCCSGTKTGEPAKLLDDDFLGIADGVVRAGVPAVLGFRWAVSDSGAKTLAGAFYESLAKQGQLDTALLEARCEVAAQDRDDITWLSPILIMQA